MTDSQALGAFLADHPEYVHPQPEANVPDPELDRERAAEARHGGRYITEALARALDPSLHQGPSVTHTRAALAGKGASYGFDPVQALGAVWRSSLSPYGGQHATSGRETTANYARKAATGVDVFGKPQYGPLTGLTEAILDWPVYRAAFAAETLADLWGQAAESEEPILATLAHCAGLPLPRNYQQAIANANAPCEGYSIAGVWVDCYRTIPHDHGIIADIEAEA